MVRSLLVLALLFLAPSRLAVHAQPSGPVEGILTLSLVQTTSGALFVTAGPNAWPVRPNPISDDDLGALTLNEDYGSTFPFILHPVSQVITRAGDGRLYLVHFHDAWPLAPDPITDDELNNYSLQPAFQGVIPQGQITDQPLGPGSPAAPAHPAPAPPLPANPSTANIGTFVGAWECHLRHLEVHADGSASLVATSPVTSPNGSINVTFSLTTVTATMARGPVVASNSPIYPVGQELTLTLDSGNGTLLLTPPGTLYCGPQALLGYCGA